MRPILVVAFSLLCFLSNAQKEKRVLGSFSDKCNVFNYQFVRKTNGLYSFQVNTLVSAQDTANKVVLNVFEQESFEKALIQILKNSNLGYGAKCKDAIEPKDLATELFFSIKARLDFVDDEPTTAVIRLKNKTIKCISSTKKSKLSTSEYYTVDNSFEVKSVSVEFEDGTIKNIFCKLQLLDLMGEPIDGFEFIFKNIIPITISSRNDLDRLDKEGLFIGTSGMTGASELPWSIMEQDSTVDVNSKGHIILGESFEAEQISKGTWNFNYKMLTFAVSDIVDIDFVLESEKEDYCPANGTVVLSPSSPLQELKKEKRSQILSLRVFSDLAGVQGDQPNGLIKIEAHKI